MEDIVIVKFGLAFITILLALVCIILTHMSDILDRLTLAALSYFYAILVEDGAIDEDGNPLPKE